MLVGVDVGGTNLRVGVIDGLKVVDEQRFHADFSGLCRDHPPGQALAAILEVLADALGPAVDRYPITGIGIGFPGFIVEGRVTQSPNLPGLLNVDLATPLRERLGRPVIVENDALAAAYGEHCLAPHGGGLIYLGLGTGVGGGLIYGGQPFPGEHGVAMEVGHLIVEPGGRPCGCGNRGCMEQYASASGVAISYRELSKIERDAESIAALAAQGDPHAAEAFRYAAEALAAALAHILKVVDVGNVVIGGGMCAAWPQLQPRFDECLDAALIPALRGRIRVTLAKAGDKAGMLGAAALADV